MSNFKPLPIGVEDFKKLLTKGYYYVDKTLFIKELLDKKGDVNLYTRPRRFGKTLNLSMLQYYFEKTEEDNSYLFKDLDIEKAGDEYAEYMAQYPVINISLKSMKKPSYEFAFAEFKRIMSKEFDRHSDVIKSDKLSQLEKEEFENIHNKKAEEVTYFSSISFLSDCLYKAYNKKVIILIDEYDVPLENAYFEGFYKPMVDLIRSAFESALKTNNSLEFAVITGCLRISKESIFTGLNNFKINTITSHNYSNYFGFTETEVETIMNYYNVYNHFNDIKEWYNGYMFGNTKIYNPWSILNFLDEAIVNPSTLPKPYWSNTSSNSIIKDLISKGDSDTREKIELLINGGSVEKIIYEDITYENVNINTDYIWSFLLFTGYLKTISQRLDGVHIQYEMVIPNLEVLSIYKNKIMEWMDENIRAISRDDLFNAMLKGDVDKFKSILADWLQRSISYYDTKENFYHGFLVGLLSGFDNYSVKSNRETGNGRSDIFVLERRERELAVVIEIKVASKFNDMSTKCDEALKQIEDKNYEAELKNDGYQKVMKYGVAFYDKSCKVKVEE